MLLLLSRHLRWRLNGSPGSINLPLAPRLPPELFFFFCPPFRRINQPHFKPGHPALPFEFTSGAQDTDLTSPAASLATLQLQIQISIYNLLQRAPPPCEPGLSVSVTVQSHFRSHVYYIGCTASYVYIRQYVQYPPHPLSRFPPSPVNLLRPSLTSPNSPERETPSEKPL